MYAKQVAKFNVLLVIMISVRVCYKTQESAFTTRANYKLDAQRSLLWWEFRSETCHPFFEFLLLKVELHFNVMDTRKFSIYKK